MPQPALDFGAFSVSEKQAMLTAAKAEVLKRMTGRVQTGAGASQSFGMNMMTYENLVFLVNALGAELGVPQPETRVQPNFSGLAAPFYQPVAEGSPSRIEPNVQSWSDLQALSTTNYPNFTVKIWVDASTGLTMTARLIPSTQATDPSIGAYRPNDYQDPGNARVWFQAGN